MDITKGKTSELEYKKKKKERNDTIQITER
jgi:hypothetical protein